MKYLAIAFLLLFKFITVEAHKARWDSSREYWSELMKQIYYHQTEKYMKFIPEATTEELNFVFISGSFRLTAMEVAIRTNNDTAVRALLQTNKIQDPKRYIVEASANENVDNVEMILNLGADPNTLVNKENRYSVLVYAVNFGSIEVVECLLKHGANVNLAKRDNWSPLIFAFHNGFHDKAELLVKYGANTQIKTNEGLKPIDFLDQSYKESKIREKDWQRLRTLLITTGQKTKSR